MTAPIPKLGVALGKAHPAFHLDITLAAESLGFESVWMPEHLIFPTTMAGSPYPGQEHPPVPPTTPVYDAFGWLCFLAGKTERVRLGTNVYLLGLRHPFVAARAIQTLDVVSNGRAEVGVGAGWLREEWIAAGLDPATRGRRLDEALGIVKRLWTEPAVEHHGEFYDFGPVAFEPKPVQKPWPKLHVGGESPAALVRAARHGDGWYGLGHTPESVVPLLARLRELRAREEREHEPFEITIGANPRSRAEAERFAELGVHRISLTPWNRSREAVDGLRRAADLLLG